MRLLNPFLARLCVLDQYLRGFYFGKDLEQALLSEYIHMALVEPANFWLGFKLLF